MSKTNKWNVQTIILFLAMMIIGIMLISSPKETSPHEVCQDFGYDIYSNNQCYKETATGFESVEVPTNIRIAYTRGQ
jgi:hypothetical protein